MLFFAALAVTACSILMGFLLSIIGSIIGIFGVKQHVNFTATAMLISFVVGIIGAFLFAKQVIILMPLFWIVYTIYLFVSKRK